MAEEYRIKYLETPDIPKTPVGEEQGSGGGAVESVNGMTGAVVLDASDVGALPDDTPIPAAVTEQTVSGWGFTKNTGTYSKPSGGIPKSDLASAVQTSLDKADTALQQHQSLTGYATETWVQNRGYQTAPFEIQITQSGSTYTTTATAQQILDNADNCVAVMSGGSEAVKPDIVLRNGSSVVSILFTGGVVAGGNFAVTQIAVTAANGSVTVAASDANFAPLPAVTASDNGKFLRVVSGAWAAQAVPAAESNSFGGGA